MTMLPEIRKFPCTPHIRGSRFQHGDHDLEAIPWEELVGKHLVIEEKCDGSNCGISFTENGELLLQSRGHYLRGGPREKQFNLLKQWTGARKEDLYGLLGSRYIMYGEWMFAKHTMWYDALPHYFMEFDVLDTVRNEFLSTHDRDDLLRAMPEEEQFIEPVLVVAEGKFDRLEDLKKHIVRSNFITDDRLSSLRTAAMNAGVSPVDAINHTDMSELMEGLYVKVEEHGVVKGRYKFVRETFTNKIMDSEEHWHDRPIVQNMLAPGRFDKMFGC